MNDLQLVINILILFFVRLAIPVTILIMLGILLDRWQRNRNDQLEH